MKRLKTYKLFNESLKDKMKGKPYDDVQKKLDHIISAIIDETSMTDIYSYDESSKIIIDNYIDDILFGIKENEENFSIATFIADLIREDGLLNESLKDKMKGKTDDELEKLYPGQLKLFKFYNELKNDKNVNLYLYFYYDKKKGDAYIKFNKGAFKEYLLIPDGDQYSLLKIKIDMFYEGYLEYTTEKIVYTGDLNYRMKQVIYNQLDI